MRPRWPNTGDAIANSQATNAPLDSAAVPIYSVHGDDFLLGGSGNDTIKGVTGDDRVIGSLGTDDLDGGKNYYAVKVLGEALTRVYELNKWEAANPTQVAALAGLTISSITEVRQPRPASPRSAASSTTRCSSSRPTSLPATDVHHRAEQLHRRRRRGRVAQ